MPMAKLGFRLQSTAKKPRKKLTKGEKMGEDIRYILRKIKSGDYDENNKHHRLKFNLAKQAGAFVTDGYGKVVRRENGDPYIVVGWID